MFQSGMFDDPLAGTTGSLGLGSSTLITHFPDIKNSVDQVAPNAAQEDAIQQQKR